MTSFLKKKPENEQARWQEIMKKREKDFDLSVRKTTKVFGIGLNKTGTTSLGLCLRYLGYKHHSFDLQLLRYSQIGELSPVFELVKKFDSFEDWPFPLLYRQLDKKFPGSKFILTTRVSAEKWYESLVRHHTRYEQTKFDAEVFDKLVYGFTTKEAPAEHFIKYYNNFNREVREYFKGRDNILLEVCWEKGDGWKEVCGFLNYPAPQISFPHWK